jgi:hypothetical protein
MLIRFYRREVVKMNAQYFVEHGCKLGIIELNKLIQSESDPIAILNALDAAGYRILWHESSDRPGGRDFGTVYELPK